MPAARRIASATGRCSSAWRPRASSRGLALPFVHSLTAVVAVAVLFGLRFAAVPLSNSYIVRVLPDEVEGTAWGLVRTVFFVVGATASSTVGVMADGGLFDEAFLVLAAVTAAGVVCYYLMPTRASVVGAG